MPKIVDLNVVGSTHIDLDRIDRISLRKGKRIDRDRFPVPTIPWWKCLWYKFKGKKIPWKIQTSRYSFFTEHQVIFSNEGNHIFTVTFDRCSAAEKDYEKYIKIWKGEKN